MAVPFKLLAGDKYTPGVQVETDLESGNNALPSNKKRVLQVGYKTTAGSATAGNIYLVTSQQRSRDLFGQGSHLAIMAEAHLAIAPDAPLYQMSYAEGGAAAAATGTVTLASNATKNGTLVVYIAGRRIAVGVASSETPTNVADRLVSEINNLHKDLPVTAGNAAGVVTLTARNKGPEGNSIRFRSEITTGIGMTTSDSAAALASGATAGTLALTNAEAQRFHYVVSNTNDATANGVIKTHQEARSQPDNAMWGHGVTAEIGTLANATTAAAALDSYRMLQVWLENSDLPVFELAARYAAHLAFVVDRGESLDWVEVKGCPAPYDEPNWPNAADIESALGAGMTPIRPLRTGRSEIVRTVHTRVTSPAYLDHQITEIGDFFDEDFIAIVKRKWAGKKLKTLSPAGTPKTVTPTRMLATLHSRMRIFDQGLDLLQGVEGDIAAKATKAEPNATDNNRLDVAMPFRPVYRAHRITLLKTYTTPPLL